ncbi:MAG: DEAD/DEAH box helicase [Oscillospiraceae bacterium]|nr:DEAD/DEAH box helicase [Oscillospiraceae bacterium]
MFKLGRAYIQEHCSGFSFDRGLEYHFGNRVRSIQFNPGKGLFTAAVHDFKERNVSVSFDAEGMLAGAQCSCRLPGKQTNAFCEHIVAVLLLIEQRDGEGFFSQLKDREKARRMFELFSYPQGAAQDGAPPRQKEAARLEAVYMLAALPRSAASTEWGPRFIFRLKFGASTYIVKNIGRFAVALSKKRVFDFSKKFSFDPARHIFEGFDSLICNFLLEILDASSGGPQHGALFNTANPDVFVDKYLCLTDRQFCRLIDIYTEHGLPLPVYKGATICEMPVLDTGVPLSFLLERDGDDFVLNVDAGRDMLLLTGAGDVLYRQDAIYRLPEAQAAIMRPFLNLLDSYSGNDFRFISEDRSRFVSEVLPMIDRIGALTIDEGVSSILEKNALAVDIYLDREEGAISADVRYRYGDTEINPFAAAPKTKGDKPDGRIIVRDVARENEILDIFAEADFKVKNGKINLYDDDSIFNFITEILPKLQNYAGVYYSQDFRNMTVKRSIGFRASLSLRDGGGGFSELLAFSFDTDSIDRDELIEIMRSIREKKRYYKLKDGSLLNIGDRETLDVAHLLDFLDAKDEDVINGLIAMPRYRALYLDSFLRNSELRNITRDRILREFISALSEPAESEYAPPGSVGPVLREYQRTGFKWLKALAAYSLGGVLADDMGLGKTLQVLVLLLSAKEEREGAGVGGSAPSLIVAPGATTSLIVAPTSLIYNWCAEIRKFTPELSYIAIYGGKAERAKLIESIPGHDVVITSYPLIRRDYDEYRKMAFRYLILDEAQYIKNPNSQNALSVKCLQARSRFALTGTPIENRLLDLWSIFDFVLPGYLRTAKDFSERYANGAPAGAETGDASSHNYDGDDDSGNNGTNGNKWKSGDNDNNGNNGESNDNGNSSNNGENGINNINGNNGDYGENGDNAENGDSGESGNSDSGGDEAAFSFMGITGDSQPARNSSLVELSGQIKPFILRRLKADVLHELPDKIDSRMYAQMTDGQKKLYLAYHEKIRIQLEHEISANGFEKSHFAILAALTRLRQICCHPALFVEGYEEDSGKLLLLQELVREAIGGGHRILLFSQFTEMLAIIRAWADAENITYHYIDGHIKANDRHRMIDEFNGGAGEMFLLSLKAGGAGINLTGADTVIHYDPWWNPAVEDQATDRAYRIGQQKTVQVIKLLTAGSIEEKIAGIQERKKQLIDAVIQPGETFLTKLSKADLDEILSLH